MARYLVINIVTKKSQVVENLDEAARIIELDPGDIEWALEGCEICETDTYTIVETI